MQNESNSLIVKYQIKTYYVLFCFLLLKIYNKIYLHKKSYNDVW